ncbi:hypothetical protein S4A8_10286 [Salinisphaera sp. S4-8]|uniref:DUF4426 domain-containing protein n=1 Tax=Salinisphaera sp. S4-8 TaxID=633357 RepID=UPI00333F86E0
MLHYSAVNSLQIPQAVADANDIERDGDTAIVMITLQKPTGDAPLNAVPANVTGSARSLMGERKTLSFKRVESANSVYSLAPVAIKDDQTLTFDLNVQAVDGRATIPVRFNQTFFTR